MFTRVTDQERCPGRRQPFARSEADSSLSAAQVLQLIALTGPSGSWRKTLTDAVFS